MRRCEIGPPPFVKMRCTLEPMKNVPSVAMNGEMRRPTTRKALSSPTSAPPPMPTRTAVSQPASYSLSATTAKAAPKSSAMPTDRSMPPVATIRVMPSATMRTMDEPSTMLSRLPGARKLCESRANSAKVAAMTARKP